MKQLGRRYSTRAGSGVANSLMSIFDPCLLSFPCGPKTLCDLREVAVNFNSMPRPGRLTSKSASVPILHPAVCSAGTILPRDKILSCLD
jgi:hypothetical protein